MYLIEFFFSFYNLINININTQMVFVYISEPSIDADNIIIHGAFIEGANWSNVTNSLEINRFLLFINSIFLINNI